MNKKKPIIIIKLGGSILTDKNKPFSIKDQIIDDIISQISLYIGTNENPKLIIIHGAGSFGHPVAKSYSIQDGLNPKTPNQKFGLAKTHQSVKELNMIIINKFLKKKTSVLSLIPSSMFVKTNSNLKFMGIEQIESLLNLGIIPVLFGDILLHTSKNFSIISGDKIIYEICRRFHTSQDTNYKVQKVIFCFDKDGIIISNKDRSEHIIQKINYLELDSIDLTNFKPTIDVTGDIKGKFEEIKKICALGIPVQLINGQKPNNIVKALKNETVVSTQII